jgi:hypothetical protein
LIKHYYGGQFKKDELEQVAFSTEMRNVENHETKARLGRKKSVCGTNIKMHFKESGCEGWLDSSESGYSPI